MTSLSATVYDSSLTFTEHPQFAPPTTPGRSPFRDAGHRRSPTKLIRSTKAVPDYDEFQALLNSDVTTAAEKELASRVVRAAEKLREWCAEIEQWGWSGSFEAGPGMHEVPGQGNDDSEGQEYSGSIPVQQVEAYESRLDTIDDELTTLEVDELKEQILGIHVGRSRPSSSYSSASFATNITLYDDFQLFVTETLIHTLPHHARLKHHLKAWTARLAVLAEIPSFLRGSYQFFALLNAAYHPLQYPLGPLSEPAALRIVEQQLVTAQNDLSVKVGQLGKQLDRMLDTLEESEDQLPEKWIDKFEAEETEYTNWSYEADKKLFQLRMLKTALANKHDMSAWVPPDPETAVSTSESVESVASDRTLDGKARGDREAADVNGSFESMVKKSGANHTNELVGGAVLTATILASKSEIPSHAPAEKMAASSLLPAEILAHDGGNGIIEQPTVAMTEKIALESSPSQSAVPSAHLPAEPFQKHENLASASVQESIADDQDVQTEARLELEPISPVEQLSDLELVTSVANGREEALLKLEGSAPDIAESSALATVNLDDDLEESTPLGTASSPIAPHAFPSNEDDAEDDHIDLEDLAATDLSFLNRDPSASTNTYHPVPSFVRRASATSIESFSRDKVKTVTLSRRNSANLSRRGSTSTIASVGDTPSSLAPPPNGMSTEGMKPKTSFSSPLSASTQASDQEHEISRPTTPSFQVDNRSVTSLISSSKSDASEERQQPEDSPLLRVRERANGPKPPLNWAMRKRRGFDVDTVLDTPRSISLPLSDAEANSSPTSSSPSSSSVKSPKSPMMPFEEQLSSVLDSLPAPIRLKSSSSHNAPTITSKNRTTSASQPYQLRSRASTPAVSPLPTLTLAPAEEVSSRRSGVNDAEIKTYNLISGKDKPIKLYIRRVGENGERIMVRVGGGWSDLGEWLRNYAEHHGRRAASESAFEVVHITPPVHDSSVISSASTPTPTSRRGSMIGSIGSSAMHGTTLPSSRSTSRAGAVSPAFVERNTPSRLQTPIFGNEESSSASTPLTGGSLQQNRSGKASGSGWDEGAAGLMGPAIAKKERPLSSEKSRWVDGVVEQAKRTVGKDGGKGTRRVFLKEGRI